MSGPVFLVSEKSFKKNQLLPPFQTRIRDASVFVSTLIDNTDSYILRQLNRHQNYYIHVFQLTTQSRSSDNSRVKGHSILTRYLLNQFFNKKQFGEGCKKLPRSSSHQQNERNPYSVRERQQTLQPLAQCESYLTLVNGQNGPQGKGGKKYLVQIQERGQRIGV